MFSAIKSTCCSGCCLAFLGFGFTASIATCSSAMAVICPISLRTSPSVSFVTDGFLTTFAMTASPQLFVHADEFRPSTWPSLQREGATTKAGLHRPQIVTQTLRGLLGDARDLDAALRGRSMKQPPLSYFRKMHRAFRASSVSLPGATGNRQGQTKNCCGGGAVECAARAEPRSGDASSSNRNVS